MRGWLGPLLFGLAVAGTSSVRPAIFTAIPFFVAGDALLSRANIEEQQRAARAAEATARPVV